MTSRSLRLSLAVVGVVVFSILRAPGGASASDGSAACQPYTHQHQAGEAATSGNYVIGARATIEGQALTPCSVPDTLPSGSFHWVAIQNVKSTGDPGVNIIQVGYGRCINTNNSPLILGTTNCDGHYY